MKYRVEQNLSYTDVEADSVCITVMNNLEFLSGNKLIAAFANGQWVSFAANAAPEGDAVQGQAEQGSHVGHRYTDADLPAKE